MDYLTFNCPFCAAKFKIKLAYAHLKGRCPVCGFRIKPPRPDLYEYKPLPVSTADEPGGLVAEDDEWPEPAILVAEEHHAGEYRFSDAPVSQPPARPEPTPSTDVFSLGPEYKKRVPAEEPLDAVPVEPPIKLAEPIAPVKPAPAGVKPQDFSKPTQSKPGKLSKPAAPPSRPAVPLDPILDDVPLPPPHAEPAKPPGANAPGSPGATEAPDPYQDDVLVPAPPRVEAKPTAASPAAGSKGPRFASPTPEPESEHPAPYADEAHAPPAPPAAPGPIVGTYGFVDAPPGTAGIPAPVGEFDHVHASPQVAPLADPAKAKKPPEAKWVPPAPSTAPPLEAQPATQEELYQYRLSEAELKPYRPPKPPDSPLWTGVWNFAWQTSSLKMLVWFCLGFVSVLLVLSWGITLAMSISHNEGAGAVAAGVGLVCVILGGIWVTLWTGSYTSACTFKIVDETANGEVEISGPDGGWKEWFISFLRLGYLLACGLVTCGFFFVTGSLEAGAVFLLILWPAVFNTFFLSNLAGECWYTIFHGTVMGKLGAKLDVAFRMYVWTFVLLGIVVGSLWLAIGVRSGLAVPGGVFTAVCALTYARMMGRVGMQLLIEESKPGKKRKRKRRKVAEAPVPAPGPEGPEEREAMA